MFVQYLIKIFIVLLGFETKEKYYMELIKNVIFFTSVIFLVTLMMVIIVENIINDYGYHVFYDDIVHCYNYVYMIFCNSEILFVFNTYFPLLIHY